jgi:hypothetical protein
VFIDLTQAAAGVATNLLSGGGGGTLDQYARNTANAAFDKANIADVNALSAGSYANSAFIHSNSAFIRVNSAYSDINTISIYANTPSHVANSAALYANGAFTRANNSLSTNNGGTVTANVIINANLQVANATTNTYIQFGDGTRQYTANAGAASPNISVSVFETTANGSQSTFQLAFNPQAKETLIVTIDGILQPTAAYNVNTTTYTITFDEAPAADEFVRVATLYTAANPYIVPDGTITIAKFAPDANALFQTAFDAANVANAAASTGKAIAMSIVFGG